MFRSLMIFLFRVYFKICYHHKIYGREHFPKGGGIIASNHISFLDPPLVGVGCPGIVHFFARDTLFKSRFFGGALKRLLTHPVRRGKGNIESLKLMLDLIQKGEKVVIFPEGKRSLTGDLLKGQLGIGLLVLKTHCQVTPAYVDGTYDIWPPGRKFPKLSGRIAFVIGSPIQFNEVKVQDKKVAQEAIVDTIMAKIADLKEWYVKGAVGSPP